MLAGATVAGRAAKKMLEFRFELDALVKAIGECKSKAEEDRIITQELEVLKQRLNDPKLDRSRGREYMVRVMYCEMLGHDASFAYISCLQFASDPNIHTKKVRRVRARVRACGAHACARRGGGGGGGCGVCAVGRVLHARAECALPALSLLCPVAAAALARPLSPPRPTTSSARTNQHNQTLANTTNNNKHNTIGGVPGAHAADGPPQRARAAARQHAALRPEVGQLCHR
jgi:hypothetical protein